MRLRIVLAAGIAALVAGCGGGSTGSPAGSGSLGTGASVAPADAAAFVAVDSDLGSSQWQALDSLLTKAGVLDRIQQSLQKQTGLSWDDLKAALGPETDLVVLPGGGSTPQVVVLTQPSDASKLQTLLKGQKTVTAQVGGWTAIGDSQAALDAVTGATRHLADDSLYQEATGKLSGDALAQVYANGAEAGQLASSLGGSQASSSSHLVWAAADVVAGDGGLKVDGFARSDAGATPAQAYSAALLDRIPSGALLVADFQATQDGGSLTTTNPLLSALGTLAKSLGGETALYVTPDLPLPAVTLVTQASDPQAVLGALNHALASAGSASSSQGFSLGSLLGGIHLSHELVGNDLVVSTSQAAIDAFKGGGAKLSSDPAFQEAQSAAGMPAQTTGFVYVNLKDALPYVQSMLGSALKGSGSLDLSSLRTVLGYGTGTSGDVSGFTAFLEVR